MAYGARELSSPCRNVAYCTEKRVTFHTVYIERCSISVRKVYALIDYCNYKIFLIKYFFVNMIKVCMFFLRSVGILSLEYRGSMWSSGMEISRMRRASLSPCPLASAVQL